MEITAIIVGGIVIISIVASIGEYFSKIKIAKGSINNNDITELKRRVSELEKQLSEQNDKISALDNDVSFANKLLGDKKVF